MSLSGKKVAFVEIVKINNSREAKEFFSSMRDPCVINKNCRILSGLSQE